MPGAAVLGGAGFIGSNLVDELIAQGFEVTVLDNFSEGKMENLYPRNQPQRLERMKRERLEVVRGDVRDFDTVRRVCDGKSWVFHLAAMSRIQPSIGEPLLACHQNIVGTWNVAEACRQGGAKRLVYSASSSAYGLANEPPHREEMPTDCLNPYSLSKKVGEEICELYRRLYGLSTVSLRYFNVYGPRHQEEGSYATVIAIFRRQLRYGQPLTVVGDGEQRRDFTFVGDVVRANILAAMNHEVHGTFNIGTGVNYSINELARMVGGAAAPVAYVPPRPGEARVTKADPSKAQDLLGWEPTVSLEDGLKVVEQYERLNPPGGLIVPA
jgi:UDP-glucose 4-epimerase